VETNEPLNVMSPTWAAFDPLTKVVRSNPKESTVPSNRPRKLSRAAWASEPAGTVDPGMLSWPMMVEGEACAIKPARQSEAEIRTFLEVRIFRSPRDMLVSPQQKAGPKI
jgi:hypothetical protein